MVPTSEAADGRPGARTPDRAERLEILFAFWNQGLGACPTWLVTDIEECERAERAPVMSEDRRALEEGLTRVEQR